ncbi:MAG: hypothetical protein J0L51_11960 [Rhizobiales bacterium]|nr:hypothetical protein [Hyphomicrobiales bacterium]
MSGGAGQESTERGALGWLLRVPCSRHDHGENDPRVRLFLGLLIGIGANLDDERAQEYAEFLTSIERLHDHKGQMIVLAKSPVPDWIRDIVRGFWFALDAGWEAGFQCYVPGDEDWVEIWSFRRFESDWLPSSAH